MQYGIDITHNPDRKGGEFMAEMEQTNGLVGFGSTEQEAIAALKERVQEEIKTLQGQNYTRIYRPEPEEIEDGE